MFRNVATWLPAATMFAVAMVAAREAVTVRVCGMLATWLPHFLEIRNRHFSFRQKIAVKPARLLGFSAIRFQLVFNGFSRAGLAPAFGLRSAMYIGGVHGEFCRKNICNFSPSHRDNLFGVL